MVLYGNILQMRGAYIMSKKEKKKKKDEEEKDTGSRKKYLINTFVYPIIPSICATFLCSAGVYFFSGIRDLMKLPGRIDLLESRIETMEKGDPENSGSSSSGAVQIDINLHAKILMPTEEGEIEIRSDSMELPVLMSQPSWNSTDIIGVDTKTGIEYTAKELVNQRVLMPSKDGNRESFFYVQFNEKNHWDGKCLINNYIDNRLESVMEAIYDDGDLKVYEQAIQSSKSVGDVWSISDRVKEDSYNSGETWSYTYKDVIKDFEFEDIEIEDLVSIEDLKRDLTESDSWLEGYYKGNTSDGYYNDNTGKAYLIKYFENGTVRTLYRGKFKDGEFEDDTGNAWYITKGSIGYMYYKGFYKEGNTVNNNGHIFEDPPLSRDRMKELLKENDWDEDVELNWDIPDNDQH